LALEYDFEQSIGYYICMTAHAIEKAMADELAVMGITYRQWQVLAWIAHDGELVQAEMAERLQVEAPTLVGILDRMERDGWIVREPHPSDRRRKIIRPTDRVQPIWERLVELARLVRARAIGNIPPEELDRLRSTLITMLEHLGVTPRRPSEETL